MKCKSLCSICLALLLLVGVSSASGQSHLLALGLSAPLNLRTLQSPAPPAPTVERTALGGRVLWQGRTLLDAPAMLLGNIRYNPPRTQFAISVTPLGVETAALAQSYIFDASSGRELGRIPGHSPRWDAQQGAFVAVEEEDAPSVQAAHALAAGAALTYPDFIRVAHHPENGCREAADWQVDVIPFDEYVARAVPAEVPASWEHHALAAQAVAARTYAWAQIRVGRPDYDVTDWANFQMMCDQRYAATDAAAAATAGQYLSAADDPLHAPIVAMYSAENGHPTLTNPNVSYLQAVPDLFSLGRTRWGHGYGLSQWGAQRRALAGQTYAQILGHYYTNVHLQKGQDAAATAHLVEPASGWLSGDWLAWRTLPSYAAAADPASVRLTLQSSQPLTPTAPSAQPLQLAGLSGAWRVPDTLPDGQQITVSLYVHNVLQEERVLTLDRTPATAPALSAPAVVTGTVLPLALDAAADAQVALNLGWRWQGEALLHTEKSGAAVDDPGAQNGQAWSARVGVDGAGVWYGPYTPILPAGQRYRAIFWLRSGTAAEAAASGVQPLTPVATLDVADDFGNVLLGLRQITLADLNAAGAYTPVAVDFYLFDPPKGLEFRTAWSGQADLVLDRVELWALPAETWRTRGQVEWPVYAMQGALDLQAATFDSAGNMSATRGAPVQVRDETPPRFGPPPALAGWLNAAPASLTIAVTDSVSGLNFEEVQLHLRADNAMSDDATRAVTFAQTDNPWTEQSGQSTLGDLVDGRYSGHFEASDRAGNRGQSAHFPLQIDSTTPVVSATVAASDTAEVAGWRLAPVTVTLAAADALSGVDALTYELDGETGSYEGSLRIENGGQHTLRYWADDVAGNRSQTGEQQIRLDLAPPQVTLSQLGGGPNTVWLRWAASDDGAGVALVVLEVQQSGEWVAYPLSAEEADAQTVLLPVAEGETLTVRLMAEDAVGRQSPWREVTLTPPRALLYLPLVRR